jgi:hypothetical protein
VRYLFKEALQDQSNHKFLVLCGDTIPVKPPLVFVTELLPPTRSAR